MNEPDDSWKSRLPEGWYVSDSEISSYFLTELNRELPPNHLLDGVSVEVVAHRMGTDDILCRHETEPSRFTVIHLALCGCTHHDSSNPSVESDGTFSDFLAYEGRYTR